MQEDKNQIPENIKNIHFIAICGTGMGALAGMLKDMGFNVTGSDHKVYPPMSSFLAQKNIPVLQGFSAENLNHDPDLVVVGNAVYKKNPEAQALLKKGLYFCSMPQAIQHFFGSSQRFILVTGTHGKTTTASILAWIMYKAGLDPSYFIGGILQNFKSNYRLGSGKFMVIEGDEYDTAFFDKSPKFLHYIPSHTILTSIEFDHADIYEDLNHVCKSFEQLLNKLPSKSFLAAYQGDSNIKNLIKNKKYRINTYGTKCSDWSLGKITVKPPMTVFQVFYKNKLYKTFEARLMGKHNLLNALSVIAVAHDLNIKLSDVSEGLKTFEGIKRRQEIRGQKNGITIIDDFAHHPTAVKETINGIRSFYSDSRIIAVFEPRTNSSMRKIFQDVYPLAFDSADIMCIRKPPLLEKIPPDERFSSEKLVDDLKKQGKDAYYFENTEGIIDFVNTKAVSGDVVLVMSNGGFDNIHERLLGRAKCC
ncbi:UDP-N-acetylmuramate: L-alanyl-gamma-D-glutamyl-meso-diaminopimelate ligase [Candidatus Magnetomoraceae bacterium gMMP-15]